MSVNAVRGAYGLGSVSSSNIVFYNSSGGAVSGDGTGEVIAIVDAHHDPNLLADVATFDSGENLPAANVTVLNEYGGTTPPASDSITGGSDDWAAEECLDVEWAHALAPGASILVIECASSQTSDLMQGDATAAAYTNASSGFSTAVVSNSFGGPESSNEKTSYDPSLVTPSGHQGVTFFASTGDTGSQVLYPAESPNVVAVGGTELAVSGTSYASETAWYSGGGGTSAYESQPTYQVGTVGTASKRETPDISIVAGQNSSSSTYISSYAPIVDTFDYGTGTGWVGEQGTSWASPEMAAIVAIADQGRSLESLGTLTSNQALTRLYQLSPANFHDITTGSNGHAAVTGYDEATGIGTPITNVLVPDLTGTATVTGRVFVDNNGDGTFNGTDTAIANQTVYLDLNNDGVRDNGEPAMNTSSAGIYTFSDQPAGGSVRLVNSNITGYGLTSAASGAIAYGSSDTVNFTYQSGSQLVFAPQPPASTPYGSALNSFAVDVATSTGSAVYGDGSIVTLTLSSGTFSTGSSTVTATASNGVATFTGLHINALGSYTLTATDGSLSSAVSNSFSIVQATPTITWSAPTAINYGTALSGTQLDATASVPGTFVYTPAAGTVLSAGAGQTLQVAFTPSDSTDYTNASGSTTITVNKATPTVSWTAPSGITYGTALSSTQLDATASVPGSFVYSPVSGTVLAAGTQTLNVAFHPTDSTDYASANGSTSITVAQAQPVVTWATPASITYGTALSGTQLNASTGVAGSYTYTPAAGTVPGAGSQNLSVVFHPTDTTDYKTATGSTTITVLQATPTVTWATPAAISYGTALGSTQLNASTGVAGSFVYTPAAGTVLGVGAGQTLHVSFTPTDTTDYTSASGSTSITVIKANPTVSWSTPSAITYGTALSSTQLDATASVPGTFVYTPAAGTVPTAGSKPLSVAFTPTDTTDYNSASGSTTISVSKATPTVSWSAPGSIVYGTALSSTQLDATASVPGTFVYTPAAGTVLGAGSAKPLSVTFTPTDATDYASANGSTSIIVTQATPVVSWTQPSSISYGTALSSTQLDATANTPGNFAYNPSAGTVLNQGANQSLGVVFTPTDSTDYTTATGSTQITVTAPGPLNLTGSSFYLKLDNASPQNLDIWTNATESGSPAQVVQFNTVGSINITASSNVDSFVADFSSGSVVPGGGLMFTGSGVAVNNSLTIVGTGASDSFTVPGDGTAHLNSQLVNYSVGSIGHVYFAPGGSGESLTVPTGTVTLAPGIGSGINNSIFSSISVAANAKLVVPTAGSHSTRTLLQTSSLILASSSGAWTGELDLTNNDLEVVGGSLGDLTSQVTKGYATGTTGIFSSAAAADATHLTTLGVSQTGGNVLVKFTYFGDANTDGAVTSADYTLIDFGYLSNGTATGWFNGDFNYDNVINGSDYTLIDNAFNQQGTSLAAQIAPAATPSTQIAQPAASPVFSSASIQTGSFPGNPSQMNVSIADSLTSDDIQRRTKARPVYSL